MTQSIEKKSLTSSVCAVNSYNEWDPLEEVIVGIVDDAMFPSWNTINQWTVPPGSWDTVEEVVGAGGIPYPPEFVTAAQKCLQEFVHILEAEGVVVRRPERSDFAASYSTPSWTA